jgi:WD40 repeat protein
VAFSPDDRLLASGSEDRTIRLWDPVTGKTVLRLEGHTGRVNGLAFSPDGKRLASAGADGSVRIWDVATGQELRRLEGHASAVTCVAFHPTRERLVSGSRDKTVRIWNIESGETLLQFKEHKAPVHAVAFSPDGGTVASASSDVSRGEQNSDSGEIIVYDANTGRAGVRIGELGATCLAFRVDGKELAYSSLVRENPRSDVPLIDVPLITLIKVINPETGRLLRSLQGHTGPVTGVVFSRDGQHLGSCSQDETVRTWDLTTGAMDVTFREEMAVLGIALTSDGSRIASGSEDQTVKIWGWNGPRVLGPGRSSVAFSPDGRRLAAADSGGARIWEWKSRRELTVIRAFLQYSRLAWSRDGRYLGIDPDGRIWDASTGEGVASFEPPAKVSGCGAMDATFGKNGQLLATANWSNLHGGEVRIWDLPQRKLLRCCPMEGGRGSCVAFSPDGEWLAGGMTWGGGKVWVWSVATGQVQLILDDVAEGVYRLSYSPDGLYLAAAIGDRSSRLQSRAVVQVWDAKTGRRVWRLRGHTGCVWSVAFSPDGRRLVSAGGKYGGVRKETTPGEVIVWDLATGQAVCTLQEHRGPVFDVAFSPCGHFLATVGGDNRLLLWDGTPLAETPAYQPLPNDF